MPEWKTQKPKTKAVFSRFVNFKKHVLFKKFETCEISGFNFDGYTVMETSENSKKNSKYVNFKKKNIVLFEQVTNFTGSQVSGFAP